MNCIIVDDDEASRMALVQLTKQAENLTVIKTCSSTVEALSILKKGNIDILFLDVEMPEMSGLEMLKALDKKPQVIITSSHKKYALDAYEYGVIDYLVKPITLRRFVQALAKIKNSSNDQASASKDFFFIKKNSVFTKVPIKDILWIEALGDYITIHTKDEKYILHTTIKSLEATLPAKFVRVHRSYIVQIDNVTKVEDTTIYINGNAIPVGATYKETFLKRLNTL